MDAQVDHRLGDSIPYSIDGGVTFTTLTGFVRPVTEELDYRTVWKVKFTKAQIPGRPSRSDLLTSSKLFGQYRPVADKVTHDGEYWDFEIQGAGATP